MKRTIVSVVTALLLVGCASTSRPPLLPPPVSTVRPVVETLHGISITDPYRWLEDQQSPETLAWIEQQNAYTDKVLADLPNRDAIAKRIDALLHIDVVGIPTVRANRFFFLRRGAAEDQYSIYMREGIGGSDVRLIDPIAMDEKHTTTVGIDDVSEDGKVIVYFVRKGGADEVEVRFFDVDARRDIAQPLALARYFGTSISSDRSTVYYSRHSETGDRVYSRRLDGGAETELFGAGYGPEKIIGAGLSDDGHYLLIEISHGSAPKKSEIYLKDLRTDGPIKTVVNDLDARSTADVAGDMLVITTNWNAPNERVMTVSTADPGRANWKEIVPENKNAALQKVSLAGGKVFVRYLENVKPRVIAYRLDGTQEGEIHFDTIGNLGDITGSWGSPIAFYRYTSFALPATTYAYDVATAKSSVFARLDVPVNPDDFAVEQVFFNSKDGTRIPMFLMYRKGLKRDGSNPTLLTGYGGFNLSQLPSFSSRAVAWAEQGGVYALVNLRGGSEFGEAWHQAGMLAKKQNVFDDFYAAAEYLSAQRYTSSKHLGITGTSNGGLLVTAAETQRPELFGAVVVGYPLIDMLRYQQFLVGSYWVPEYGSSVDAEQFKWLYAYSPYHHVVKGTKYPATLFITGDADTRVAPLHARKMTALMQASNGASTPILLRYHVSGGHSGGEPVAVVVKNEAETLGFLLAHLR
jgi:prolyl oligopeptidase